MKKGKETKNDETIEMEMLRFEIRDLLAETEDIELLRLIYLTLLKSR